MIFIIFTGQQSLGLSESAIHGVTVNPWKDIWYLWVPESYKYGMTSRSSVDLCCCCCCCCECTHKLFNLILPPSPLQTEGLVDHMGETYVSLSCTHKEPLHMQIHTRVSVVWICAWWHHNELLHHTAHFLLTIRYTGFKAFHTK